MFKIFHALARLCIIVHVTDHFVWSDEAIYVSRSHGYDSTACGKQFSPCRTISYAIHQVSEGSYIYLDGTGTSNNPYTCESFYPGDQGIHLTKSVSFERMKSRAYISCVNGNQWLINGTQHKDALRVSFYGFAFQNTSIRFLDASVHIIDCWFKNAEHVTMNFTVMNLARFELAVNNSVFQQNAVCMAVESNTKMIIHIRITDSTFTQNGDGDSSVPSILRLSSEKDDINIQISNCSFQDNTFGENGMILVENGQGTTNVSLYQFKFEENGHRSTISGIPDGVFFLLSAHVIMNLEFGFVYSTFGSFLTIKGRSAQINVSNAEVYGFYSPDEGGGVIGIYQSTSCFLSIKNSSFRNGKSSSAYGLGGVLAMIAPISKLTIQNSTFHNISDSLYGGAIYVQTYGVLKSGNHCQDIVAELNIIDSSFSDSSSGDGGAIFVFANNLFATVIHSSFERNSVKRSGGALLFNALNTAIINFHSVYFFKNIARDGGIFQVGVNSPLKESTFKFTTNNVSFVKNEIHNERTGFGILHFWTDQNIFSVLLKSTRFISNIAVRSGAIALRVNKVTTFHSIILDTCIFSKNVVNNGVLRVKGQATLVCRHSIFDSNGYFPCLGAAFGLSMNDSKITITNTTFVNNSCGAVVMILSKTSWCKIEDSIFVRNRIIGGSGSAISATIFTSTDQIHKCSGNFHHTNILIQNVMFEGNIASSYCVLKVDNGNTKILNSTFVDNFSRSQGGQIGTFGPIDTEVFHSVFKQTIQKNFTNGTEFTASSFLRIHSTGQLLLHNTTFNSNAVPDAPLILASKAKRLKIDTTSMTTCPVGFGIRISIYTYKDSNERFVTVLDLSCSKCDYNYYSIQRGHIKGLDVNTIFKCTPCPRGADCLSNIRSKPNFWGYHANFNPPILAFTLCPFGYCQSPHPSSHKYNDCQGHRTGVMCGMCSDGYTEALWSTCCAPIEECNDQWFWIAFLALVFSMAILVVFKPPFIKNAIKHVLWFLRLSTCNRCANRQLESVEYDVIHSFSSTDEGTGQENVPRSSTGQLKHDKRQFSRFLEIIFYFYQIAPLLLSSYSLTEFFDTKFLPPVLGFFNFEPSFNKRGFVCPFPGLTPKTKLLFKIVPVFGTMIAIFAIYFWKVFISKIRGTQRPCISPYLQASIKTILLGYVTLAIVSISLIRCVSSVAGERRWFYNGNIICHQWWQYLAFVFNGIFVIPFIFVLALASFKFHHNTITARQFILAIIFPLLFIPVWLYHVFRRPEVVRNVDQSQNLSTLKEMLLGPYKKPGNGSKHGAIYWQSVLIARRFILVLIFCTVTEPSVRLFCMTFVCVCVLSCHLIVKPFQNSLANNLESLSLLLLVILALINLFKSVFLGNEGNIKGSLVTVFEVFQWLEIVILGLFPALLSLLVCFALISLIIRVLFVCFKCLFRRCIQRFISHEQNRLLNICEEND